MLLSVIIPTFKRHETLGACLKHLSPEIQNVSPDLFEVIVTDDAPGDETRDFLVRNYPRALHHRGPQKGPAANRNSGAKSARGEWLVFLDDDCLPQPSFLSAYIEAIGKNPDCLVFEGCTLAERPRIRLDEEAPINDRGGYLWSCNFLIQRKLFLEMGGFCELYPYACMEDVDFREQLREKNIRFLFVPGASVVHPWRPLAPDSKYLKMLLTSHAIFFERYPLRGPSLYRTCKSILRVWAVGLLKEAPRLKFRGFWRYVARQSTLTRYQLLIWSESGRKQSGDPRL
ncbi:MAG TPA: glycosyltransferase [Candidatus Methylacidiphilales bacterium]|jgi:glycosyltransferase involved in cell wall biosynthesis|nr:glycosyltransferase [Candidatus Methylacidiphilales bacterium]